MDRDRLKQVHETDLTESRINQDFLDWLRNRGSTYLLIVLVVLIAWMLWIRFQQGRVTAVSDAFAELNATSSPDGLEQVASDNDGIKSVPELARLQAADTLLMTVLSGQPFDAPDERLTPEQIESNHAHARSLYTQILQSTENDEARRLFAIQALIGLATLDETRDDGEAAAQRYARVKELAKDRYPSFATLADSRLTSLEATLARPRLASRDAMPDANPIDPLLRDLLEVGEAESPDEGGQEAGGSQP